MALNYLLLSNSSSTCYRTPPISSALRGPASLSCAGWKLLAGDHIVQRAGLRSGGGGGGVRQARLGSAGGAGVLERPGLDQSQSGQEPPQVEEGGEMGKLRQRRIFGGGNRYRVLLLDHEKHTEGQVTAILPKVVPSITAEEAKKCFQISREMGVGLVTVTVKEHAEFYAQMMARCGLRSGIEPDSDTI